MAARTGAGTVYEVNGPPGAPVVTLIHGLGLNRHIWQPHIPALSDRYRVLSYDLYGHGESAPPPVIPSLRMFSEQLGELFGHHGIDGAVLVGFSLGGMINRRFALDHADRVRALGILNSPHERSPDAQKLVEERAVKTAQGGPGATLDTTIERWFTSRFRDSNPSLIDQVRQWVLANDLDVYTKCRQVLAHGVIELIRPNPPIMHPTLVMTCENDSGSTPAMSHAIAAEIEDAQTIIVPDLQHMGLCEQPALFTGPLRAFLDRAIGSASDI